MKILAVDDSKLMRTIISGAAQVMGYETLHAGSGREALEILETESSNIAAITLDVNMPEMSGMECLEALKADPRFTDIPVIMVTTEAEKDTVMRAIRLGAKHYVTKPFTPEAITTRLMEVLDVEDEF